MVEAREVGEGNETNTIDTHGGGPYGSGSGIWFVRGSLRPRRTSSLGGRRHGRREVCGLARCSHRLPKGLRLLGEGVHHLLVNVYPLLVRIGLWSSLHQLFSFPNVTMISMLPMKPCFKRKLGFREELF